MVSKADVGFFLRRVIAQMYRAKQIDVRVSLQFLFWCGGVTLHGDLKVAKNHFQPIYYPTRLRWRNTRHHTSHRFHSPVCICSVLSLPSNMVLVIELREG